MVTIEDVIQAREIISRHLLPTPLIPDYTLSERLGRRVWLKAEMFQQTGSFKARGALHWVKTASPEELAVGLGAVSAGNHALGLAWAAGATGTPVTIVMPGNASPVKVDGARELGAEVVLHGDINDAWTLMRQMAEDRGLTLVHPYDDPRIIAGQGSVGLEIMEQAPETAAVLCPIGGGGLISGIGIAASAHEPHPWLIGVEPEGAASMAHAWQNGHVEKLATVNTCAKSLAAAVVGEHTYPLCRQHTTALATVDDDAIREAIRHLLFNAKVCAEPGAAVGVAALLSAEPPALPEHGDVVVVLTGGNLGREELEACLG